MNAKALQNWMTTSPHARRAALLIALGAGAGMVICLTIITATVLTGRAVTGIAWLQVLAIPAVGVGQLWMIGEMKLRHPSREPGRPRSFRRTAINRPNPRTFFFGGLSPVLAYSLIAVQVFAVLIAARSSSALDHGNPTTGSLECPYALNSHGYITCISRAAYLQASAVGQRFGVAVLLAFFTLHLGGALSTFARLRTQPALPAGT